MGKIYNMEWPLTVIKLLTELETLHAQGKTDYDVVFLNELGGGERDIVKLKVDEKRAKVILLET